MSVITGAATTSAAAAASSTPTSPVVVALNASSFDTIAVTILPQSIVGWLAAVVYRTPFTVAESWVNCQFHTTC